MAEYNLFGEEIVTPEPEAKLSNRLGSYDRYEVVSAFRKDIKLGDVESAFFWLTLLLKYGGKAGRAYVIRQCWIMMAEDLWDVELSNYCASIQQMEGIGCKETDHFYALVYRMCFAKKWWDNPHGRNFEYYWAKAEGDVMKHPKPIPTYALDQHTWRGKQMMNEGKKVDDRFSGSDTGREKTNYLFQRDGMIRKELMLDDGWEKFRKDYKNLYDGNANDLKPEDVTNEPL